MIMIPKFYFKQKFLGGKLKLPLLRGKLGGFGGLHANGGVVQEL